MSYPPPHHYAQPAPATAEPRNGLGLAALIVALVGLVFGFVPLTGFIALICGITALGLGLAGLGRIRRGRATNTKTTWAGVATAVLAGALGIWGISIVFSSVDQLGEDLEQIGQAEATPSAEPADTGGDTASEPDPEPAPDPEPEYHDPKPEDFELEPKILDKQCFGSAGCNVTYRIIVTYTGTEPIDPATTYEVVYEVSGVEDGPQIGTFELTDGESSVQAEEFASTSSESAELTAKATDVL